MGIGCDPETEVSGFFCMFCCHSDSTSNGKKKFIAVKGPRDALFYMGPRFGPLCVLLLKK